MAYHLNETQEKEIKAEIEKYSKKKKTERIILIAVIVILTNVLTFSLTSLGILKTSDMVVLHTSDQTVSDTLNKMNSLEKVIRNQYYQDTDTEKLMEGALKGMFSAIGDEYSEYYNAEEFKQIIEQTSGSFEGVGILVREDETKTTVVITPYKDTPAGNAGMQTGDRIIQVNGEDVSGKGMDYTVSKIRGEKGTEVTLVVERDGEKMTFTMKRDDISVSSVDGEILDGGIGYIEISQFIETTGRDFSAKLDELEKTGINSLIIDLRFNGGGLMDQAVEVAGRIIGDKLVVSTVDKQGKREESKATSSKKFDKPVIVLVNDGSASASEILAGALQDYGAARLVGTQTFGKGIVQAVQQLKDGTGFKLTIASYFTPKDRNIHGKGLTPDVIQEQPEAYRNVLDVPKDEDSQLQKAIELLNQ